MILFFEKTVRFFLAILSLTNQYIMLLWILAAVSSLLGFMYAIFSVNKSHRSTYLVKTLTGFMLMLGAVGLTVYFSLRSPAYQSKALGEISPYGIELVQIGSDGVSVGWSTRVPTRGYIVYYSNANPGMIAFAEQGFKLSTYHNVKLKNLKANTVYRYSIIINGREFTSVNGAPLKFATP